MRRCERAELPYNAQVWAIKTGLPEWKARLDEGGFQMF